MKKTTLLIFIFIIFFIGLLYIYPRISIYKDMKTKFSKDKTPIAYIVPKERKVINSMDNQESFMELSCEYYKFKVPWTTVKKEINTKDELLFGFHQNKGVAILPRKTESDSETINNGENSKKEIQLTINKIKELLDGKKRLSQYDIFNLSLNTTPDQISFFTSQTEVQKKYTLLILKALYTSYGNIIYKFETRNIKGFQFNDPSESDSVSIHFFDRKNRAYRMNIYSADQDEIDFILSTIKFLDEE